MLITGGTGSLGMALTKSLLKSNVDTIRIFSRDEWKQSQMRNEFDDKRLRFLIGDIRDAKRLVRATEEIDIVIHAAALKQVPVVEYNPFEAVKTNVYGTQNLIDACRDNNVEVALAIGTDKAVSPLNTYGASKMLMERLFISSDTYRGNRKTKFICVRYGNVLGSRGSILPTFISQIKNQTELTITDPNMTRFNITINQAINLIFRALKSSQGGEVFVPKLKAYKIKDMKDAIQELMKSNVKEKIISVRPGEKYHEVLINREELRNTFETDEDYIIFEKPNQKYDNNLLNKVKKTSLKTEYSSESVERITKDELKEIIKNEKLIPEI